MTTEQFWGEVLSGQFTSTPAEWTAKVEELGSLIQAGQRLAVGETRDYLDVALEKLNNAAPLTARTKVSRAVNGLPSSPEREALLDGFLLRDMKALVDLYCGPAAK